MLEPTTRKPDDRLAAQRAAAANNVGRISAITKGLIEIISDAEALRR